MTTRIKIILTTVLIVLLLALLAVAMYFSRRISMNPDGTVGNTAGNLNNGGFFCEYNGTVYFYNSQVGGGLFSMNPDESNMQRLNSLKVGNILAGGDYLYYFQQGASGESTSDLWQLRGVHSFDRCRLNGSNAISLTTDVVVTGQLVNNYLYLLTSANSGISFYKMKIDHSDQVELADYIINPACVENGIIYYTGMESNHYLYTLNTATDVSSERWHGNIYNPVLSGDYVYYMEPENNYRLCRYSFSQDLIEILTNDRVDCFNVGGGYIYYQKNSVSEPQLICMASDGSNPQVIAEGNYTHINITSRYVYFQAFGDDTTMYHSPIGGYGYSIFSAPVD